MRAQWSSETSAREAGILIGRIDEFRIVRGAFGI